jgi:hypothetical protein
MYARRRLQVLLYINLERTILLLRLLFLGLLFFNYCLSCGKTSDWHSERRATHIGEPCTMAELHTIRIAAVFATDA